MGGAGAAPNRTVSPTPLVAVALGRPEAEAAVRASWDAGEAVAVLDPAAPAAALDAALAHLRPTHLVDTDGRRAWPDGVPAADDVRAVVLTSGTTGRPKAVELTDAGLAAVGRGCNEALDLTPDDRWLVCLPLHHVAGLAILARARIGGQAVTVHPGFDLAAVAAAPQREGATVVSLVPTMLRRLLDADAPLHQYRRLVLGGAPLPGPLRGRAAQVGAPVVDAYGLSETGGGCVLDGRPIPGAEVELGVGDEIRVRGAMVMRGYRFDVDATRAALGDGWLRTGDAGAWADDGSLVVVDRRRDLVISGGVNVSPTAVEQALAEHPSVADVCVTGAPDEEWGERVVAFVVVASGQVEPSVAELRTFARRRLRAPELPRQVVVVEAIPRTPGGKAQRQHLTLPR
jgi:o-succinylbenzoate---CoA ligase